VGFEEYGSSSYGGIESIPDRSDYYSGNGGYTSGSELSGNAQAGSAGYPEESGYTNTKPLREMTFSELGALAMGSDVHPEDRFKIFLYAFSMIIGPDKGGASTAAEAAKNTANSVNAAKNAARSADELKQAVAASEGTPKALNVIKNNFEYVQGFDDHMINAQGIIRKGNKGVVGGHNLENFEYILTDQGWKLDDVIVSKSPHPTVSGLYEIEYRLPALDRELNIVPGQYKNIPQPKTVYDPNVITNDQMVILGKEAMEYGVINGRVVTGYASNGLRFTGYLDENGKITNFHPSLGSE
jgi:hypothetical protein